MTISLISFAQTKVSGVVTDKDGAAVPGAMVLDKDSGKWAVTDSEGVFVLEGTDKGHNLEISCMGYSTGNVLYQGEGRIAVRLEDDTLELEETVVIGYGSVKKKDLTGSVGVLDSKIIEQQSTAQLSQSLQGAIPGLQVTRSSSMPGASASLKVRGVTSINGTSPLILVDGMAVSSIDQVASDDVEQITVLKDAASASIYGSRAAAGVILITTKSAKEGQLSIGYNGEYSMITATEWAEYLTDPYNYMTMFNEYKWNDAGCPEGADYQTYPKSYIDNYAQMHEYDPIEYPDFDWKSNIVKKFASAHNHNLTLSYGNKVVKTRASFGYNNTDALYEGSNYEKMTARIRNSINITKRLTADVDFSFRHTQKNDPTITPLQAANMYPSIYLGLYPDGRIAMGKSGGSNTLGILREGGYKSSRSDIISGNIALTYKPIEGLSFTASYKPTWTISKGKTFSKRVPVYDAYDTDVEIGTLSGHATTDLTETRNDANSYELSFIGNYDARFGEAHNFNAMLGYEEYSYQHESLTAATTAMELNKYPYLDLANKENVSVAGDAYGNGYRSVFGRVMYNYKSRYYIQANVRGDGSSRFAKGYRWGWFPSASVGWVISNENWMQNVKPVSYLKLRASVGTLGNERLGGYYPYQASISFSNALFYGPDGSAVSPQLTAAQVALAVQDITWETTWTYDIGLDINFFRDRLSLSADYYYKQTRNMLLSVEIPEFTGYGSPTKNVGTMYTNGWEAKIDWHDRKGDFTYGIGFNVSDARSVMGDLGGKIVFGDQIIKEGEEYYAFYGYRCNGIIQNEEQLINGAEQLIATVGPGDLQYQDLGGPDGTPDGKISADYDKTILGSSQPHFIFGGYLNFGWKGLNLGILFNGVGKQTVRLAEYMVRPFAAQWLSAPAVLLNKDGSRNYWSVYNSDEVNAKAEYPRLSYTTAEKNNYQMSDYWLVNGAYFRVKNINLSYTLPSEPLKKAHIKGLKFYFNIDDPFCFDNYLKGWDPEQTTNSYIARTFTLGVDIKF